MVATCCGCGSEVQYSHTTSKPKWCTECRVKRNREKSKSWRDSKRKPLDPIGKEMVNALVSMGRCPCCGRDW